jgi:hypothetical protein
MRNRHRPGPEGSTLGAAFDGVHAELSDRAKGREPGSLLCGDIRAGGRVDCVSPAGER